MRKPIVVSTLALAAIAAACDQAADTPTASIPGTGHYLLADSTVSASAQGGGKATTAGGSTYHFAFSADVEDGSTRGNAMLRVGDTRYNADVVCLGVRGDTAVIVGVVRSSSDAGAVGDSLVFTAIDGSDRIGEPQFPAAGQAGARCASVTPGATLAVDAGQVKVSGNTFTAPVVVGTVVGMGTYDHLNAGPAVFQTNITRLSDGTVSGEHREEYPGLFGRSQVLTVTCLTLQGDTAYIGGTISGDFGQAEGGVIMVDNAPSTSPDQITRLRLGAGVGVGSAQDYCNGAVSPDRRNLSSGDISITP